MITIFLTAPPKISINMKLHIGSHIRKIRKIKGYPEKHLASELGITIGAYSKLEHKDSLSIEYIIKIADILEVPYTCIIEFNEKKFMNSYLKDLSHDF